MWTLNRAIDDRPGIQQEAICYQWFKQWLILSISKPSISQQSQIKEDTVEPSQNIRRYNLTEWSSQPGPQTQTRRSPQPGSAYHNATNSATEAGKKTGAHFPKILHFHTCQGWGKNPWERCKNPSTDEHFAIEKQNKSHCPIGVLRNTNCGVKLSPGYYFTCFS